MHGEPKKKKKIKINWMSLAFWLAICFGYALSIRHLGSLELGDHEPHIYELMALEAAKC